MSNKETTFIARGMPEAAMLDSRQAAYLIGTTYHNIRLSRSTGWLFKGIKPPPHCNYGRAVRYRKADLEVWLAQFTPKPV